MEPLFAIIILSVMWAMREFMHHKNVEQLLAQQSMLTDKLMARNFEEYKELTAEPRQYEPVERTEEEEWAMEQKERLEQ